MLLNQHYSKIQRCHVLSHDYEKYRDNTCKSIISTLPDAQYCKCMSQQMKHRCPQSSENLHWHLAGHTGSFICDDKIIPSFLSDGRQQWSNWTFNHPCQGKNELLVRTKFILNLFHLFLKSILILPLNIKWEKQYDYESFYFIILFLNQQDLFCDHQPENTVN